MCSTYEYAKAMGFPSTMPEAKRERYRKNAAQITARRRERYEADPEYRDRVKAANRERYANDPTFRERVKARVRQNQMKAAQ